MKNMFKNAGKMVLFTCLSLMLLTACGQKSKLKLAIAAANKQCPMDMGASGEISSITFDGSDVVYVLLMNESFLNIDALKENPDAMKSAVTVMFGNPQGSIKEILSLPYPLCALRKAVRCSRLMQIVFVRFVPRTMG